MHILYDRVTRNIQNRAKLTKHMNSFINARFQRKLRKFAENPLPLVSGPTYRLGTGFRVLGPTFRVQGLGSRVPPLRCVPGLGTRVPPTVPGLGSHFSDMPSLKRFCYLFSFYWRNCF